MSEDIITKGYAVYKGDEFVASLEEVNGKSAYLNREFESIEQAREDLSRLGLQTERVYGLEEQCTIDDHRPCELKTAIGMATGLSEEAGVPVSPKLNTILNTGVFTEAQVKEAMDEWKTSIPEQARMGGDGSDLAATIATIAFEDK